MQSDIRLHCPTYFLLPSNNLALQCSPRYNLAGKATVNQRTFGMREKSPEPSIISDLTNLNQEFKKPSGRLTSIDALAAVA